jgi:IS30 family transposase
MVYYTQLKETDRVKIYKGLAQGLSVNALAQEIARHKSTIYRELQRNSDRIGYLYPRDAHEKTKNRKARHGSKINRNPDLKAYVIEQILLGRAPVVIAGRWNKNHPNKRICAETVYQFAYHQKNIHLGLWKHFPKAKKKRGLMRKKRKSGSPILHRISIHQRPAEIENRETFGHFEADLMFNKGSQSINTLTVIERKSRMVFLVKHNSKHSLPIIESIKKKIGNAALSCTFDNGTEFSDHWKMGIPTYFCDPGSPWQKGSVENMNGLLRKDLPFELDPKLVTQEYLDSVAYRINNTPRKSLGYSTPMEVFLKNLKKEKNHFNLESPILSVDYQKSFNVALHI